MNLYLKIAIMALLTMTFILGLTVCLVQVEQSKKLDQVLIMQKSFNDYCFE